MRESNSENHRLAAIMFVDIAGYSRLMSNDESRALNCVKTFDLRSNELILRPGFHAPKSTE